MVTSVEIPFVNGMDFGTGVDTPSGSALNVAVVGTPSTVPGFDGSTTTFRMERVESFEDLLTSLGVSAQASASYGLFSASARFNYAKSCAVHSSSVFLVVSVRVTAAFSSIRQPDIRPAASDLLANGDTDRFREQFGDMFVRGILGGGQFFATIEVRTRSETDKEDVSAGLRASYAAFGGSGTFDQNFEQTVSTHQTKVTCFIDGGRDLPIPVSIDTMTTRAVNFPAEVKGHAVPYFALLNSYAVLPLPKPPNFATLQHQKDVLTQCSMLRNQRIQWLNEISHILANPAQFEDSAKFELSRLQNDVSADLNSIATAASRALDEPKNAALPVDLRVASPQFPHRVATAPGTAAIDLAGLWVESVSGRAAPVITTSGNQISIDMSANGRPEAHGTMIDDSHITVHFPDDGRSYIGRLIPPGTIFWSNDTAWIKVGTSVDTIFDLNGVWAGGSVIEVTDGIITIDMSIAGRPDGHGAVVDARNITVYFSDDRSYTGELLPPNMIAWSNNTTWMKST